jgi:CRISPR-associated protein Csb2
MALAAAWFETEPSNDAPERKRWEEEGNSLKWLEKLGDGDRHDSPRLDPRLVLPPGWDVSSRKVVTVFVPVNGDRAKDTFPEEKAGTLQSAPSIARKKNDRTFPTVWVGDSPCFLHWPHVGEDAIERHRAALERLCGKVTRIGHSSSLVWMWLADGLCSPSSADVWVPDDGLADFHVRRVSGGTLDLLERQFNGRGREEHARLATEIESLSTQRKTIRGKGAAGLKADIDRQIEERRDRLQSVDPRPPIRPKLGLWTGYRREQAAPTAPVAHSDFDSDLLILTQVGGPRLPLASTLAVTQALRGAVMSQSGVQPPPSWVSGHVEDSQPLRDGRQHLAYVALPVVSGDYADGHLLGAALVFPNERIAPRQERGRVLGRLLLDADGRAKPVRLTLGPLGEWTLTKRDWSEIRHGLKPETWTAHPHGATTWATVTPLVLDRFPKADAMKDRAEWEDEVADIIATACGRLGLPSPAEIRFGTTSWHRGSPRASVKRRPLRGQTVPAGTATLGDGFPTYPAKGSNGVRPQLHVFVRFAEPVVGPILLGAGRFLGYGLCKPLQGGAGI